MSSGESKTILLGAILASVCVKGCIIFLYGNVGSGKSIFCKGFLRALGYTGHINSPTYTLIESYIINNWYVHHFDFYRLSSSEDIENIGFRDFYDGNSVCLIEWPKKNMEILPVADIFITVHYHDVDVNVRKIIINFVSNLGRNMFQSALLHWDVFHEI